MGEMQLAGRSLKPVDEPSLNMSPSAHPMLDKLTAARAWMSGAVVISGAGSRYITMAADKRC